MNKTLTFSSISNIQNFLSNFKKSLDFSYFSLEFITNSMVFVNECQLPDMWIKTRTPIDRNEMYYIWEEKRRRKVLENYKRKPRTIREPVYFPW
jgi:hypothetical protein